MSANDYQNVIHADWVTTKQAAAETGYTSAHLRRLAIQGAIPATRVGREWLVNLPALRAHQARMAALGNAKHSPWREDLAAQGRGRAHTEEDAPVAEAPAADVPPD